MSAAKSAGGKASEAKTTASKPTKASEAKTSEAKTTASKPRVSKAKAAAAPEATLPAETAKSTRRQQKVGRVVSNKMQKTIVVAVESHKRHPLYKRTYKATNKFKAHDEHNDALIGDMVRIEETRPLSKDKRWRLVEITKRAVQAPSVAQVVSQLDPETEGR